MKKRIMKALYLLIVIPFVVGCAEKNEKPTESKTELKKETDCSGDVFAYNLGREVGGYKLTGDILGWGLSNFDEAFDSFCEANVAGYWEWKSNECVRIGYNDEISGKENPYQNLGKGSASNQGIPKNSETQPIRYNTVSETLAKTSMSLDKKENDFGIIQEGDTVECDITVTNTGGQQLILEDARGSCVGLIAEFSKDPIPVGQSRNVKIKFNSIGKSGKQYQSVVFIANTEPIHTGVAIFADVLDNAIDGD